MMKLRGSIHESLKERKNLTIDIIRKGVLPVFAVSCVDGILLVGISNRPGVSKIKKLLDRVAFAGAGNLSDSKETYNSISSYAKLQSIVYLSAGDMRVVEDIRHMLSMEFRRNFRDLYSSDYVECELIIATLGFSQNHDELHSIDFTGSVKSSQRYIRVPNISYFDPASPEGEAEQSHEKSENKNIDWEESKEIESRLTDATTMADCLKIVGGSVDKFRKGNPVFMEVRILSRQEAQAKRFDRVYKRLSQEEVQALLF